MKNKKNLIAILCGIGIALVTLVLLIPFFYTFLLSIKNYSAFKGIFRSEFVGLSHFTHFFSGPYFLRVLKNSLFISLPMALLAAIYVYLSSVAIASSKNPFLKGFLTVIFVLPALVSPLTVTNSLYHLNISLAQNGHGYFLLEPGFHLPLIASFYENLRLAGFVVFAAYFIKNNIFKESLKCVLLFVAIRLICLLTNDSEFILGMYSPQTYESLDVLSTYIYRSGMMNGDYSLSAAAHIARTAIQFFPAVIACVILLFINKKDKKITKWSNTRFLPAAVFGIVPLGFFFIFLIAGILLLPAYSSEVFMTGYLFEFLYAFLSALLITVVAYLLALATRYSKIVGCIALTVLTLTAGSLIGPYLMIRGFSLLNTVLGPVFLNMSMIPILALILSFALYRENTVKSNIVAFILGFIMMFIKFWGSYLNPIIAISDDALHSFSVHLMRINTSFAGMTPDPNPLVNLPYILIPLLAVVLGLLVCAVIYIINTKKKAQ